MIYLLGFQIDPLSPLKDIFQLNTFLRLPFQKYCIFPKTLEEQGATDFTNSESLWISLKKYAEEIFIDVLMGWTFHSHKKT